MPKRSDPRFLLVATLLSAAVAPLGAAQQPASPAGSGAAAVYTQAQAERGRSVFRSACAACHVAGQFADSAFRRAWTGRPVFDLFEQIRTTMPYDNPGRLRREQYADVVAYLLKLNGVAAGEVELTAEPEELRRVFIQPASEPRYR